MQLNEAFATGGYADLYELRQLYYGRYNLYGTFSDDISITDYDTKVPIPKGIVCFSIQNIVGRRVSTNKFYCHVFRPRKTGGVFLEDIRSYSRNEYDNDLELLSVISYLDNELLQSTIGDVEKKLSSKTYFEKMWEITKRLAFSKKFVAEKYWRRILLDLGYIGFTDNAGLGILGDKASGTTLILNEKDIEQFDIVPIQKYRSDQRKRIQELVEKRTKLMATRRNRVAKIKTPVSRDFGRNNGRFF